MKRKCLKVSERELRKGEHCMCGWSELGVFTCCKCGVLQVQVMEDAEKYFDTCEVKNTIMDLMEDCNKKLDEAPVPTENRTIRIRGWEFSNIENPDYPKHLNHIVKMGILEDWEVIDWQENIGLLSFRKGSTRLNIYTTKMTVGTCLDHPKKGKTQLYRKNVDNQMLMKIFKNPRIHTRKGYQKKETSR